MEIKSIGSVVHGALGPGEEAEAELYVQLEGRVHLRNKENKWDQERMGSGEDGQTSEIFE